MSETFILRPGNARDRFRDAWNFCCTLLQLDKAVRVQVEELRPRRSIEQNDKFHAICSDFARDLKWAGKTIDKEGWKRLLIDAWARETGRAQASMVPSLDGSSVVNLGIQSHKLSVGEMSELIEWAIVYAVDKGVRLGA
jgi:hypothetical protein